jgi:hypothetical protein
MTGPMHSRYVVSAALVLFTAGAIGCGASRPALPETEEFLFVGVDPQLEATELENGLSESGYGHTTRVEGDGWVALAMTRPDGASVARLVTTRGVVVALDEGPRPLTPTRGLLDVEPTPPSGTDVDGDGTIDVVLARIETDRRCLLVIHLGEDGSASPLALDPEGLAPDACLEALRDVDGNSEPEAIVRVRAYTLARSAPPTVDLPLERDEAGVYRRVDPAARFVADERRGREARLLVARAAPAPEDAYTLAVELALLVHLTGETPERQVEAFDEAMSGVVLTEDLVEAVHRARGLIAAGTAFD